MGMKFDCSLLCEIEGWSQQKTMLTLFEVYRLVDDPILRNKYQDAT